MKYLPILLLIISVYMTGCSKKKNDTAEQPTKPVPAVSAAAVKIVHGEYPPDTVLISVNGETLTAGVACMLVDFRVSAYIKQIPPDQVKTIKANMLIGEVEKFIEKTVIMQEAERQKIVATQDDQDKALKQVAARLPAGTDLEKAMDSSPWGRENLIKEMITGIKTTKLLTPLREQAVDITDEEIDSFYQANKSTLDTPESVGLSHILIKIAPEDSDASKAEKKSKLTKIRDEILKGADFVEMAKKHSECASGKMGGNLGPAFKRGQLLPEFEKTAFSQAVGDVGPIIETKAGYHIVKVTAHNDAAPASRERITEIIKNQKRERLVMDYVNKLIAGADIKRNIDSL